MVIRYNSIWMERMPWRRDGRRLPPGPKVQNGKYEALTAAEQRTLQFLASLRFGITQMRLSQKKRRFEHVCKETFILLSVTPADFDSCHFFGSCNQFTGESD